MDVPEIRNIEDLVRLDSGKTILWHEVKRLTAPGENYGSLMLSVTLTVKSSSGTEKIYVVAKMVPPNELIQKIFNTQITFRNEIGFYEDIVPTLQNFQLENGVDKVVDFAAKCYGSRLNLGGGNKVDSDGALVLDNLKVQNFVTLERTAGLDFEAARLVLVNLAQLHGTAIALKMKKPEEFEKKIKPYLALWQQKEEMHNNGKRDLARILDQIEEIKPLKERVLTGFDRLANETQAREPFATIAHNDCWTNNNMFKLEGGKPVKSVLVDFQVCNYGSPARDLVFFLFSSVKNRVIEEKYGELLKEYHQVLISVLEELKCDTSPYTFEALQEELDIEAKHSQFGHVVFMLTPIYMDHDQAQDISELSLDSIADQEPSEAHKQKLTFIVKEFARRNWI